jgi:HlyD family secretion protein
MKKRIRIILVLLLSAGVLVAYDRLSTRGSGDLLLLSGTVEAVEVAPSFQVAGRVVTVSFEEGGRVAKGAVLAALDDAEPAAQKRQAASALAAARARMGSARARADYQEQAVAARTASARAVLDKARAGLRPSEVERARAAVEETRARSAAADEEARRTADLFAAGAVSQARRDNAARTAEAARAALRGAEETLHLAEEGTRGEDLAAAEAALAGAEAEVRDAERANLDAAAAARVVEQAEADLSLAETRLSRSVLLSPLTGVVLTRAIEPGEMASPGVPVASLADTSTVTVRVFVSERALGRVKLGMPAKITTDSTGKREFPGKVTFISDKAEFTPKTIETREERVKLVYRVKVEAPNPDGALKPGMPADVDLRGKE